jgi:predicted nucleic acid-binding Zn ribbon protein
VSDSRRGYDAGRQDRRAGAADRDRALYERKRATQARRRAQLDRRSYDPAPADPDEEFTVADADGAGLARTHAPSPVGDALEQLLKRRGWGERLTGATASQRWEHIVGADLAARCEPVRLAGGTLVVRAESQVWATQLRYLLPQLQANANEVLGAGRVREVRLVVGPLEGHGEV